MGCHGGPLGKFGAVVRAAQRAVRSWGRFRDRLAPVLGGPETELRYERLLSKRLLRRTEPFPTRKSYKNANMDGTVERQRTSNQIFAYDIRGFATETCMFTNFVCQKEEL